MLHGGSFYRTVTFSFSAERILQPSVQKVNDLSFFFVSYVEKHIFICNLPSLDEGKASWKKRFSVN